MWIIPSNLPQSSHFVQGYVASKEELKELFGQSFALSLTVKSKPSQLGTLSRAWKRIFWMPHLCGRMLKPSHHNTFVERYMECWPDTHASRGQTPESEKALTIHDTFGRIYSDTLESSGLFGADSRTSEPTLPWASTKFCTAFAALVTQLRQDYSVRKRQALLRNANAYSSSPSTLRNWPTPDTQASRDGSKLRKDNNLEEGGTHGVSLHHMVHHLEMKNWPTPTARDHKGKSHDKREGGPALENVVEMYAGPHVQEKSSTTGKRRGSPTVNLNPHWVAQLMGTTSEKIFFVLSGTPSSNGKHT